jgi:hypothetical protein
VRELSKKKESMDDLKYALLVEVVGRWEADIIENYLKAEGVDVVLVQESLSDLFTPTFAPVKIYVAKEHLHVAKDLLKAYNANPK